MRSTRLPGKMLADIAGKPLVAWVAQRALESGADEVIVATDHHEIADAVASYGIKVCTTATTHETGTDRLAEAVQLLGLRPPEIVGNLQGDEPLIDPKPIPKVPGELALRPNASVANPVPPNHSPQAFFQPNHVKGRIAT